MFNSQPFMGNVDDDQGYGGASSSCPLASSPTFGFIILFNWNEGIQRPFKLFPRRTFKDEIRSDCIDKDLKNEHRIKKLRPLSPLPGQKLSLFGKVEDST